MTNNGQTYATNWNRFTFLGRSEQFLGYLWQETCLIYSQSTIGRPAVSNEGQHGGEAKKPQLKHLSVQAECFVHKASG